MRALLAGRHTFAKFRELRSAKAVMRHLGSRLDECK
jgi:hypothetical protein